MEEIDKEVLNNFVKNDSISTLSDIETELKKDNTIGDFLKQNNINLYY